MLQFQQLKQSKRCHIYDKLLVAVTSTSSKQKSFQWRQQQQLAKSQISK